MTRRRPSLVLLTLVACLAAAVVTVSPSVARAATPSCALTAAAPIPSAPSPGSPCWVDYADNSGPYAYPFGVDGNPVDQSSTACFGSTTYGPNWQGDFSGNGSGVAGTPPCYLQVNSLAFRAWNRGLAATGTLFHNANPASIAFGVWLFNGTTWFPDPTFPGSASCPGSTVLWAGKLDYWLVGSASSPQRILCRFDGVNLQWEPISLPGASVARLPVDQFGNPTGGVTSGACYAWNNCWFFGDDGIQVHWDGQSLTDASAPASSPWLAADFTGAVAGTDAGGNAFGLAAARSSSSVSGNPPTAPVPTQPDGSPPPQLFGSQGGPFAPLAYSPPATAQAGDPFTTDLTQVTADTQGDVWAAADPASRLSTSDHDSAAEPAPLLRLSEGGASASCPGYGARTFTYVPSSGNGYAWKALTTGADGSALAAAWYRNASVTELPGQTESEPALVQATCGQSPVLTEFRRPDPLDPNQATARLVPADQGGFMTAVAVNAVNDGWAATTDGGWGSAQGGGATTGGPERPHLYRWTDGGPPQAPAGDDNETRPSLFTLDPPVYQQAPPPVVVVGGTTTTTKKHKRRKVKLKPAIYALHSRVRTTPSGTVTLSLTFHVRRPVTIGLEALRGRQVVSSTGLRHFRGRTGTLTLVLDRKRWPTHVRLISPKRRSKGRKSSA